MVTAPATGQSRGTSRAGRRPAIIHDRARFLAAHGSGLTEWLPANGGRRCLILIDTVPYAREAERMLRRAVASGMTAVVVTEERNTWAAKHRLWVFFVVNRVETYIESSGPLTAMLSLIVSAVAARNEAKARARPEAWPAMLRALDLF